MRKILDHIKDSFIKGLIFLVPLLVILFLLAKAIWYLKGFSTKIAKLFGMKTIIGNFETTLISSISILVFCVLAGYIVRLTFMASFRDWLDSKLADILPGYSTYREMALQKLNKEPEKLPYAVALLIHENSYDVPGFLMDTLTDGRLVVFVPVAGNAKEGRIIILPSGDVKVLENVDINQIHTAINKLGTGMATALG
jgi:uncharacterized membrane protein